MTSLPKILTLKNNSKELKTLELILKTRLMKKTWSCNTIWKVRSWGKSSNIQCRRRGGIRGWILIFIVLLGRLRWRRCLIKIRLREGHRQRRSWPSMILIWRCRHKRLIWRKDLVRNRIRPISGKIRISRQLKESLQQAESGTKKRRMPRMLEIRSFWPVLKVKFKSIKPKLLTTISNSSHQRS